MKKFVYLIVRKIDHLVLRILGLKHRELIMPKITAEMSEIDIRKTFISSFMSSQEPYLTYVTRRAYIIARGKLGIIVRAMFIRSGED